MTCYLFLQADAVLVGEDGKQFRVHSLLLIMKFPYFRTLPKVDWIFLQGTSSDVIELIVDLAYGGMNRFKKLKCSGFGISIFLHTGGFQPVDGPWGSSGAGRRFSE